MLNILTICGGNAGHSNAIDRIEKFIEITNIPKIKIQNKRLEYDFEYSQNPRIFCLYNIIERIDEYLKSEEYLKHVPNLIIYDFFSVEGLILSKYLNIPAICSIPAQLNSEYIKDDNQMDLLNKLLFPEEMKLLEDTINNIKLKYNVSLPYPYLVSDGYYFHVPEFENIYKPNYQTRHISIVWNYKCVVENDILFNPYQYIGSAMNIGNDINHYSISEKNIIYCSLGTIVPNSMFKLSENNNPKLRELIINIYKRVIEGFTVVLKSNNNLKLVISCPKDIYQKFDEKLVNLININKNSIEILEHVNQVDILDKSILFITHGGGNSFQEAFSRHVPMMILPFFGDQYTVAKFVDENKIGISYFLTDSFKNIEIHRIDDWLDPVIINCGLGQIENLSEHVINIIELVLDSSIFETKYHTFKENIIHTEENKLLTLYKILTSCFNPLYLQSNGDLFYGTTKDRISLTEDWNIKNHFQIGLKKENINNNLKNNNTQNEPYKHPEGYLNFHELSIKYPIIVDQWNDLLRTYPWVYLIKLRKQNNRIESIFYNLAAYRAFLIKNNLLLPDPEKKLDVKNDELLNICGMALDYFITIKRSTIHLVIKDYFGKTNIGTELEIQYILYYFDNNPELQYLFNFWRFDKLINAWTFYYGTSGYQYFKEYTNYLDEPAIKDYFKTQSDICLNEFSFMKHHIYNDLKTFNPNIWEEVWFQSRIKHFNSFKNKVEYCCLAPREITDVIGFRVIHPSRKFIHKLVQAFKCLIIIKNTLLTTHYKHNGNVIYLLGKTNQGIPYEIQFWTTILYTSFITERHHYYKYDYKTKYSKFNDHEIIAQRELDELNHREILHEQDELQKKIDCSSLWNCLDNLHDEQDEDIY